MIRDDTANFAGAGLPCNRRRGLAAGRRAFPSGAK